MPPLEEFTEYLQTIWDNKIFTNNDLFHQQFEQALAKYLSVFSNGTMALMTALQSLRITGEVITTPFSFIATTHSIWWKKHIGRTICLNNLLFSIRRVLPNS